jgi:hypothetical protein
MQTAVERWQEMLLQAWLVERDGKLRPPISEMVAAVMWFSGK